MRRAAPIGLLALIAAFTTVFQAGGPAVDPEAKLPPRTMPFVTDMLFEPNIGQTAPATRFVARGPGYSLLLGVDEAVLSLSGNGNEDGPSARLRTSWLGANPTPAMHGVRRRESNSSYFVGDDPGDWHARVPHYAAVRYDDLYDGIDVVFYGTDGELEYDFVVEPSVDPGVVRLRLEGADRLSVNAAGDLVAEMGTSQVIQRRPVLYQQIGGARVDVDGAFVLQEDTLGFEIGEYDGAETLVIDPKVSYSSFYGGIRSEFVHGIDDDGSSGVYIVGTTDTDDLPGDAGFSEQVRPDDAFVARFDKRGNLKQRTYIGGDRMDRGFGIAVAPKVQIPIRGGRGVCRGGEQLQGLSDRQRDASKNGGGSLDAWAAVLSLELDVPVSTYLGGKGVDFTGAVAADSDGRMYVTGSSTSTNFPTTDPTQGKFGGVIDAFVWVGDPSAAARAGSRAAEMFSTYLGGNDDDLGLGIQVASDGTVHVLTETQSTDFPFVSGLQQHAGGYDFGLTRFDLSGTPTIDFSTFWGGSKDEQATGGLALDRKDVSYFVGTTFSTNYPTVGAIQNQRAGVEDAAVGAIDIDAAVRGSRGRKATFSTYRRLVGIVHFFAHPDTWESEPVCYLQDLYVAEPARGVGVGAALIEAVHDESERCGWASVYWHTMHDNTRARGLYDKLTGGTDGFVTYRLRRDADPVQSMAAK